MSQHDEIVVDEIAEAQDGPTLVCGCSLLAERHRMLDCGNTELFYYRCRNWEVRCLFYCLSPHSVFLWP